MNLKQKQLIAKYKRLASKRKTSRRSKKIKSKIDQDLLNKLDDKLFNRDFDKELDFFENSPFSEFLNVDFFIMDEEDKQAQAGELTENALSDPDLLSDFPNKSNDEIIDILMKEFEEDLEDASSFQNKYDFSDDELIQVAGYYMNREMIIDYLEENNREDLILEYLNEGITGKTKPSRKRSRRPSSKRTTSKFSKKLRKTTSKRIRAKTENLMLKTARISEKLFRVEREIGDITDLMEDNPKMEEISEDLTEIWRSLDKETEKLRQFGITHLKLNV